MEGFSKLRKALSVCVCAAACLGSCAPALPPERQIPSSVKASEISAVKLIAEGNGFASQGRYVDAALKFHQALYLSPKATNVKRSLAGVYEKLSLPDEAEKLFKEASSSPPSSQDLAAQGRVELLRRNLAKATSLFEKSLEEAVIKGDTGAAADLWQSISALAFRRGNEELALCAARQAAVLRPSGANTLRLARLLIASGRLHEAATELGQADIALRSDSNFLLLQGFISLESGAYAQAAELAARTLRSGGAPVTSQDTGASIELGLLRDIGAAASDCSNEVTSRDRQKGTSSALVGCIVQALTTQSDSESDERFEEQQMRLTQASALRATRGLYWPPFFAEVVANAGKPAEE